MLSKPEEVFAAEVLAGGDPPDPKGMMQLPQVREVLVEAMEKLGVTPAFLAETLASGLKATERKFFAFNGTVTDEREVEDWNARHKFMETALEIHGVRGKNPNVSIGEMNFHYKSNLRGKEPQVVELKPPEDVQVQRRMMASKARNRSYA